MSKYAAQTTVSSEKSRAEIESILRRYGATQFASGWTATAAQIGFEIKGRQIRFILPLPDRQAKAFTQDRRLPYRSVDASTAAARYEQAVRQRWRALALVIKAKLEAVDANISTIENEFMAHIVLPSGETVAQWLGPQIHVAYETKAMPLMLPDYSASP